MKNPKVSIIIINYNGKEYLKNCLESIKKNTKYPNYEVVVVDNHSNDKSVEMIKEKFPNVKVIENKKNYAFAGASNIGIKKTNGKYVVLLDNDTIVYLSWLSKLVETAENNEKIGIVSSFIIRKGLYDYYKGKVSWNDDKITKVIMNDFRKKYPALKRIGKFSHVSVTATLLRRSLFDKIGPFSDYTFLFWEDTELCWRAVLCGYTVLCDFNSLVFHYGGGTHKNNPIWTYEKTKNRIYTYLKLLDWYHSLLYTFMVLIQNFGGMITDIKTVKPRLRAFVQILKDIKLILNERKKFERIKTVDTKKLINLMKKSYKFEEIRVAYEKSYYGIRDELNY